VVSNEGGEGGKLVQWKYVDIGRYSSRLGANRKCLDNLPNIVDLGEMVLSENEADFGLARAGPYLIVFSRAEIRNMEILLNSSIIVLYV
jgi:hypothetical protein